MSLSHLLPLGVPVIGSLAADAADTIADGLSFAQSFIQSGAKADKQVATDNSFVSLNDTNVALGSVRSATEDALKHFHDVILGKLEEAGIDTSRPIRLRGDGQGGVVVDGIHPQRAAIEQIFREDTGLTGLFNYLSANYGLLNAHDKRQTDAEGHGFTNWPRPGAIDDTDRFALTIDADHIEVALAD